MPQPIKLVVLDGDDTLWSTTPLYDAATKAFGDMAAKQGLDSKTVIKWLQEHDVVRAKTMGYSMHRFPGTLRDAAIHFGMTDFRDSEIAIAALALGYNVFDQCAEPKPDAKQAIETLRDNGWTLVLLTAGEDSVQRKRIADFPWTDLFNHVHIVLDKNQATFKELANEFGVEPDKSWVVGDSLRADIIPACAAGFNAVHVVGDNWCQYETMSHELPSSAHAATSLRGAADLILVNSTKAR